MFETGLIAHSGNPEQDRSLQRINIRNYRAQVHIEWHIDRDAIYRFLNEIQLPREEEVMCVIDITLDDNDDSILIIKIYPSDQEGNVDEEARAIATIRWENREGTIVLSNPL